MHHIEVTQILHLLSAMFDKCCAYSASNSAKCAITIIVNISPYSSINKHPLNLPGLFYLKPPKPKLSFVWDVDIVIRYFKQQGHDSLPCYILAQNVLP